MTRPPIHACEWFQNLAANAGHKGFSVVAHREGEHRSFFLEARALENEDISRLVARDTESPLAVSVAIRMPLAFCPSCGVDLRRIARTHQKEFDELAEECRVRLPEWQQR